MAIASAERRRNRLLRKVSKACYDRLEPSLTVAELQPGQVVYEQRASMEQVYFPINCVLSSVNVMRDGNAIEVGTIGNEGAAGLTTFLAAGVSPHRTFAQIAGTVWIIDAAELRAAANVDPDLNALLLRHHYAFLTQVSQSAACNGLHPLQLRCCRWLLMTHDRVDGDELSLTHEFLSYMLGVRRAGVTESLHALQAQGLVSNGRGAITVIDRAGLEAASCECYQVVVDEYERLLGPS